MKALTLTAPSTFSYGDVPDPAPAPDEVLVAVRACGICGSDVHGMDGSSGRRIPPIVMGHEAAGEIVAVGEAVESWSIGDRVTFDSTLYCGACDYCREGAYNLCDSRRVLGVSCAEFRQEGAFAERVVVPSRVLFRLPDELPFERAAFAEPVSVALHAVNRAAPAGGECAVVVGAGLIGLLVVQALKAAGCAKVIAADLSEHRLGLARQLGADLALQPDPEAVTAAARDLTGGRGADIAMEVVGFGPTLKLAAGSLRKGGRAVIVGNLRAEVEFPLQTVVSRELDVLGSCAICGEYPDALQHIADGTIRVDPLISQVAPLEDGAAWFEKLHSGGGDWLKVILQP